MPDCVLSCEIKSWLKIFKIGINHYFFFKVTKMLLKLSKIYSNPSQNCVHFFFSFLILRSVSLVLLIYESKKQHFRNIPGSCRKWKVLFFFINVLLNLFLANRKLVWVKMLPKFTDSCHLIYLLEKMSSLWIKWWQIVDPPVQFLIFFLPLHFISKLFSHC